ncbi:MAG: phage major capsid protein [Candidatus Dormibacteraeota bacterium]|nr:phage major capsid protein [Candidatus Dormibacteraeota bacterium]
MGATDALLARLQGEIEERSTFMDNLVEGAEKDSRDLTEQELTLLARTRERIQAINLQVDPLREAAKIAEDSRKRTAQIAEQFREARDPDAAKPYEYRSAGGYILDYWRARLGHDEAAQRIDLYNRAASHQTTADNPGLLPEQILAPVVQFIDAARPLVLALGPRQLPAGSWSRPRVTQHTKVGEQSAEKAELVSQKMTIDKVPVTATTYGGYVNVSRQNIDWSQPGIMDLIINDLAAQYSIETENATADDLAAAATAGPVLPATPTAEDVAAAVWTAAGAVWAATKGQGGLILACSPDMLGLIGPLFAPVNPQNAQSTGFSAGSFGQGAMGAVSGITAVVSAGLDAGTILVLSTAAAEVYEDRIGALQVVEPSVLGVQVAYAGYFADLVLEATGVVKITKATGP